MRVEGPVDLEQLERELAAAAVVVAGLGYAPDASGAGGEVFTYDGAGSAVDLPPEAAPVVGAHDGTRRGRTAAFEAAEDAERLRAVAERAAVDPAFAALAELALKKTGG